MNGARAAVYEAFKWPLRCAWALAVFCGMGLIVCRYVVKTPAPLPAPAPPLTSAQREEVAKIAIEVMKGAPINHVHFRDGTCFGSGCDVEDELSDCVPPDPPAEWADGGYEKIVKEWSAEGGAL